MRGSDFQPPTPEGARTQQPRGRERGVRGPRLSGQGAASAEAGLAGSGESLAAVAPSRGAHVTAVCFGRGSCRGQCKGVTPERVRAGVRGGGRPGMSAGVAGGRLGWRPQGPGQSRPVTAAWPPGCRPNACNCQAGRNEGHGRRGLFWRGGSGSSAPKLQGASESDWEGRPNTSSTWRTFSARSSCSSRGFRFPHALGILGLGWEVGGWPVWPGRLEVGGLLLCGHLSTHPAAD